MNDTYDVVCDDTAFGPAVSSTACRGGFDLTVTFEETILSILPSAVFLCIASVQAVRIFRKRSLIVKPSLLYAAKLAAISIYAGLQLALIVLWSTWSSRTSQVSVASSALGLCAALGLAVMSPLEHRNSPRPSFIIVSYLLISLLFDVARVRTAWLLGGKDAVVATTTASISAKAIVLLLETVNKRSILISAYTHLSFEATSGIFSRGLFWWLASLLQDGSRSILKLTDLFSIHEKLDSNDLTEALSSAWAKSNHKRKHSLALATFWAWRSEALKIAFPRLAVVAFSLVQPFIIQNVVENVLATDGEETRNQGLALIGAVALAYAGTAIATGFYEHLSFRLMTMVRGGLIGLIYQKLTKSPTEPADGSDSAVMTLIGTDVERICETWYLVVSEFIPSIIQLGAAVWLLERQLGAVCIAPVLIALLSTAISFKAAAYIGARQKIWLEAVQARVTFTAHIMGSLKSVKMLGLSDKLQQSIQTMRVKELELSKKYRHLSSFNVCLSNLPDNFGRLATFAAFVIVAKVQGGDSFTLSQAISSLSILTVLMSPLGLLLYAIPQIFAALGCFERVQFFLSSESWRDNRAPCLQEPFNDTAQDRKEAPPSSGGSESTPAVQGIDLNIDRIVVQNATFGWSSSVPVVHDVSLHASRETQLTIILGPVGCGKSTLLKGLLGETSILGGSVWTTSKEISFCDQSPWISTGTVQSCIIGPSAFDQDWYDTVLHACALDVDVQQLQNGHETNVGSQGVSLSGGQKQRIAIARALYSRKQIALFDDVVSGLDAVTKEVVMSRVFGPEGLLRKLGTTTILATHYTDRLDIADQVVVFDGQGHILEQGPPKKVSDIVVSSLNEMSHSGSQSDEKHGANPEEQVLGQTQPAEGAVHENRQIGDFAVYKYYFSSLGWLSFLVFAGCVACEGAFGTMQYAWLKLWSESPHSSRTGYWLGLYALFAVLRAACLITSVYYLYVIIVPKSAKNLHQAVLQAAFRAPMSFLSKTETGVLVNRFSQDMQLVDMILPSALTNTSFQIAACLSAGVLTIVATPYFAAVLPFMIAALYFLQRFYLRTSRQLRLLELESKAPLFSHIIDTINGMASIRAYSWAGSYTEKTFRLLHSCQKPFYLLLCIQRWLTVVLGLIVAILATLLTALAVNLRGSNVSAGFAGIALVNMMSLSRSLANLVMFWTALETSLGAVSRVKSFSEDTPREDDPDENTEGSLPVGWPAKGALTFDNWTAAYSDFTVLHGINASILPGQKIAICGRTGSGKSSLVTSILGMVEGTAGKIIVDDIDLSSVSKGLIRKKLICITQDPFLFGGSVRLNLDPLSERSDAQIEAALDRVSLWTAVQGVTEKSNMAPEQALDVEADDLHLSQGQSQLFCLARALLRKSPVVLLDEPTSSVDLATEIKIQEIVEKEFQNSTVVMITHRLSGICKFDKVAVLDRGVLVEFGPPAELLADKAGALSKLYDRQNDEKEEKSAAV